MSAKVLLAALALAIGTALALNGCSRVGREPVRPNGRTSAVGAFYPLYEALTRVGGDRVRVSNLTPAGTEPHDLELTPAQTEEIQDAAVVVVLGRGFQPAVERAAEKRRGRVTVRLLDQLPVFTTDQAGKKADPHVWLDPVLFSDAVHQVRDGLVSAGPAGREIYERNAEAYRGQLQALDQRFRSGLASCQLRLIVTAHDAFGYLSRRYGLEQRSVSGISPDAEPDPRRLGELVDLVRRRGVTTVFTERLVSPRVAQALAREAGVGVVVLDPIEGLTPAQTASGASYVSVMDENLRALRSALDCR